MRSDELHREAIGKEGPAFAGAQLWAETYQRPTRIIWAIPRASLRSAFTGCAKSTAFMWRVSTHIIGRLSSRLIVGVMPRRTPEVALETTRRSHSDSDRGL